MFVVVIALEKAAPSRLPTSYIGMGWAGCILIKSSLAALKKVLVGRRLLCLMSEDGESNREARPTELYLLLCTDSLPPVICVSCDYLISRGQAFPGCIWCSQWRKEGTQKRKFPSSYSHCCWHSPLHRVVLHSESYLSSSSLGRYKMVEYVCLQHLWHSITLWAPHVLGLLWLQLVISQ